MVSGACITPPCSNHFNTPADCDSWCQQNPINDLVGFEVLPQVCSCLFSGGLPNPLPAYDPAVIDSQTHPGNGPIVLTTGVSGIICYTYDVSTSVPSTDMSMSTSAPSKAPKSAKGTKSAKAGNGLS